MIKKQLIAKLTGLLLTFLLISCSATVKLYEGPELQRNEIAIVKVSANFGINYPTKTSIIPIHLKEFSTVNNKWLRFEEYQGVLSVDKYISKN